MELKVGNVIAKLRKDNKVTQEQLAQAIGVSTPAVSKWETGVAYPDITMLPRIARYFNTTVDNLLGYEECLAEDQLMEIINKCIQLFSDGDFDGGIDICEKALNRYPRDYGLKMCIGIRYSMYKNRVVENEDKYTYMINQAMKLLDEVVGNDTFVNHDKLKICSGLASAYLLNNQEDRAIEVLSKIPKLDQNPELVKASIYLKQTKIEEAAKIAQDQYNRLTKETLQTVGFLIINSFHTEDYEQAIQLLKKYEQLLEESNAPILEDINCTKLYITLYGKRQNGEMVKVRIQELINKVKNFIDINIKNKYQDVDSTHAQVMFTFVIDLIRAEINRLENQEEYSFLQQDEEYKSLIEELSSLI